MKVAPEEMERVELEARMIASRIHEMRKESQTVTDKESGELRPMEYRDIVILLRSVSGMADTFVKVLLEEGIPRLPHRAPVIFLRWRSRPS